MQGTTNTGSSWFHKILKMLVQINAKLSISPISLSDFLIAHNTMISNFYLICKIMFWIKSMNIHFTICRSLKILSLMLNKYFIFLSETFSVASFTENFYPYYLEVIIFKIFLFVAKNSISSYTKRKVQQTIQCKTPKVQHLEYGLRKRI